VNTSVQVGGAIGLAVLTTFATERTDRLVADGEPAASALNSGYHLAYLIAAGMVLLAIAIAVTVLRPRQAKAEPLPVVPWGGCQENGMRVVIGCGGCTATTAP
jgi:hypothetical protein